MAVDLEYLVTTRHEVVPTDRAILMIDGTVPSWRAADGDAHWDHHRPKGALVQIDEMPDLPESCSLLAELVGSRPACIVTTMLDADACVAAAWLQLTRADLGQREVEVVRRLRAIAFDCDHLGVPEPLSDLATFAANVVATLKTWPKPEATDAGPSSSSQAFKTTTQRLVDAARGDASWPGEQNEAKDYWASVAARQESLLIEHRVSTVHAGFIADLRDIDDYVDPRAVNRAVEAYHAAERVSEHSGYQYGQNRRMNKVILSVRGVKPEWHDTLGLRYSLGVNAMMHPSAEIDLSLANVWQWLTLAEARRRGKPTNLVRLHWDKPSFWEALGFDPWGGRSTVGGSGWNSPSKLLPNEVLAIVRTCLAEYNPD